MEKWKNYDIQKFDEQNFRYGNNFKTELVTNVFNLNDKQWTEKNTKTGFFVSPLRNLNVFRL